MARTQCRHVGDERIGRKAIDDIGEQHRQRALAVARREIAKRAGIVGLDHPGLDLRQHVHHAAHAAPAALGRDEVLDAVGERHDPDVIVVLRRRVRQLERGLHREVEPRHTGRHVGSHQPAGIQHEQHLLAALGLVLARDHHADTATAKSQRSNAVEYEASGAAALAPAPQRHDGHRLAANGARLDSQRSRRLWAAQDLGTYLTYPQAHPAPGGIGPAVGDLPGVPHRQRRQRLAAHGDRPHDVGVDPDQDDQHQIGKQHHVETPRRPESGNAKQRQDARNHERPWCPQDPGDRAKGIPQPDERRDDGAGEHHRRRVHAVGASIRSRIALSA